MMKILLLSLVVGMLSSCGFSKKKEEKENKIVIPEEITPEERTSVTVQIVEEEPK